MSNSNQAAQQRADRLGKDVLNDLTELLHRVIPPGQTCPFSIGSEQTVDVAYDKATGAIIVIGTVKITINK
jgi:hypothetical protein